RFGAPSRERLPPTAPLVAGGLQPPDPLWRRSSRAYCCAGRPPRRSTPDADGDQVDHDPAADLRRSSASDGSRSRREVDHGLAAAKGRGTSWWNVWLIVPGCTAPRLVNEKSAELADSDEPRRSM